MSDTSRRTIRHPALEQPDPEPRRPVAPELEDCCRSGCTPCVFDLHEAALERYEAALAAWQARRGARARNA